MSLFRMAERLSGRWQDSQGFCGVRDFDAPQEKDDRVHAGDGIQPQPEGPGFLRRTRYSGGTAGGAAARASIRLMLRRPAHYCYPS